MPTPNAHRERSDEEPERSLASRPLLFVALRTTGPDPTRHDIVELSAVRAHPVLLFVGRELTTRVRALFPERCTPEAVLASSFDPTLWDDATDLYDALTQFTLLADGCILVGHDVLTTRAFLASGFRRAGLEDPSDRWPLVDTTSLAWPLVIMGALRSLSLDAVCEVLGIRMDTASLSRGEVARTMEVYRRLMAGPAPLASGGGPAQGGDEDVILAAQAARLAEGRHTYGSWRASDGRNNAGEALLEVMVALNYCAAELVRLARMKEEVRS